MSITTPDTRSQHRIEYIRDTFSNGDCWALAQALCQRYEGMTLWALGFVHDGFSHVVAHDARTDLYVDILGAHTSSRLMEDWSIWDDDWDVLVPISEVLDVPLEVLVRRRPEVPLDEGIALVLAEGWDPPPLRA